MQFDIDIDLATAIRSPCRHVCVMDHVSGFCKGCQRTMGEIMDWPYLDEAARRAVISALAERRAGAVKASGRSF